jgi:hypothetical protein
VTFSEGYVAFAVKGEARDTLTFTDSMSPAGTVRYLSFSDTLILTDDVHQTHPLGLSSTLTFTDLMNGLRNLSFHPSEAVTFSELLARQLIANKVINEGLPFTEALGRNLIRLRQLSEALTFSESMVGRNVKVARDTLTFTDDLTEFVAKLLKDSLDFDSIFYLSAVFRKPANDVFEMYDRISVETYLRLNLSETVIFSDTMRADRIKPISDSFTFAELTTGVASKYVPDELTLVDTLDVTKVKHVDVSDSLNFTDSEDIVLVLQRVILETLDLIEQYRAVRVKFGTASDSFSFSDELHREVHVVTAPDTMTFSDTLTYHKIAVGQAADTLSFTDSIFVNTTLRRSVSDTISFQEKPPADYQPSSSIGIPDVPSGVYGTVANKMMIFIGQSRSVVITPPEFNDYVSDRNQVIFKRRMDASVTTFIKTCKDEKLHYEFIVNKGKADEFRAFLDAENGRAFTIYDWKGQVWVAKLLTDTIDKEEVGRWEPFGNKTRISVEFLGRRYA